MNNVKERICLAFRTIAPEFPTQSRRQIDNPWIALFRALSSGVPKIQSAPSLDCSAFLPDNVDVSRALGLGTDQQSLVVHCKVINADHR